MPTGPRGEKRPVSSISSIVKAMKVATGIEEEEYVDGKPHDPENVVARSVKKAKKVRKARKKAKQVL